MWSELSWVQIPSVAPFSQRSSLGTGTYFSNSVLFDMPHEILTNEQMKTADDLAIASGIPGFKLMQHAGEAVAKRLLKSTESDVYQILCGPGNNGGDGFIVANHLKKERKEVHVYSMFPVSALGGDAKKAADKCAVKIQSLETFEPILDAVIVDALFGTGFRGDFTPEINDILDRIKSAGNKIIAVDIPSGVNGATGEAAKNSLKADITVTFARKKLGHCLYPGRGYCGKFDVADIGIRDSFIRKAGYIAYENHPDLWLPSFPRKTGSTHKYMCGSALINAAPEMTGATRMAATGCARMGAGITNVLSPQATYDIYRSTLPAHIITRPDNQDMSWIDKITAGLIGSGGISSSTFPDIQKCPYVIDADALAIMPDKLNPQCVITPHEGEFKRIQQFQSLSGTKVDMALEAAKLINAVVVLKGADTVVAHPDGRCVVNTHSSPYLATAGTGDVLAGMITGLLAQGVESFDAACMGVWIHGDCGHRLGAGLVATDITDIISQSLNGLLANA